MPDGNGGNDVGGERTTVLHATCTFDSGCLC